MRGLNPRRNFPVHLARKRTESNFLCAFERVYRAQIGGAGIVGRDVEVSGYGIADWVWLGFRRGADEARAYSVEMLPRTVRLHAFELKISDWRKALKQAFRYSYFADRAIVVVPPTAGRVARRHVDGFRRLGIGLWIFDVSASRILRVYTPRSLKPRNEQAKQRAIELLLGRAKLRKLRKFRESISQRFKMAGV